MGWEREGWEGGGEGEGDRGGRGERREERGEGRGERGEGREHDLIKILTKN